MSSITSDRAAEPSSGLGISALPVPEAMHLRDLSGAQWKSGVAAWLGWLFDGLDMHLYTMVAAPVVAGMLNAAVTDPHVQSRSAWIQAAFLIGWALGGGLFGRLGDRIGRSKALSLTILTYAAFTGFSFFAHTWWQLLIFRFLSALGIGGEWAVGSALLSETWPSRWRPWVAAVLQTAVNIGVLFAAVVVFALAHYPPRCVFLVGIVPALVVFWIRKKVPEPAEWVAARQAPLQQSAPGRFPAIVGAAASGTGDDPGHDAPAAAAIPRVIDLFRGPVRSITVRTVIVCASSLTAWWAFMFWINQHVISLSDLADRSLDERKRLASVAFFLTMGANIPGNFFASLLAKYFGYPRAIAMMFLGFFLSMAGTFIVPRGHVSLLLWVPWVGFFAGVYGLFTMYLPPLFPTLLRTTGAGFSYNIGRLAAAFGTVFFGLFAHVGDFRHALLFDSMLFIPAIAVALTLPELEKSR